MILTGLSFCMCALSIYECIAKYLSPHDVQPPNTCFSNALRKWQFDLGIIRSKRSTGNHNAARCTLRKTNAFALYKFI